MKLMKYLNITDGNIVEAFQWGTPDAYERLVEDIGTEPYQPDGKVEISLHGGLHYMEDGEWITFTRSGHHYVHSDADFKRLFRPTEDNAPQMGAPTPSPSVS